MVSLFSSYAEILDRIQIALQEGQYLTLSRNVFFYGFAGVFLIISTLVWIVARLLPKLPKHKFPFANKDYWYDEKDTQRTRRDILQAWPLTVGCCINVILLVLAKNLSLENHIDGTPSHLAPYYFFIVGAIFLSSISSAVIRFQIKKQHLVVAMAPR
jgi:hypothetical protein